MDTKKLPDIQFTLISMTLDWPEFNPNNQVRTKIMESTLFTELTVSEEANLSGGAKSKAKSSAYGYQQQYISGYIYGYLEVGQYQELSVDSSSKSKS